MDDSWRQRFSIILFAFLMAALVAYGIRGLLSGRIGIPRRTRNDPEPWMQEFEGPLGILVSILVILFGLAALVAAWYIFQGL